MSTKASTKFSLSELARHVNGRVKGDGEVTIMGVAPITSAQEGDLTFIRHKKYIKQLKNCRASALIVQDEFSENISDFPLLVVENPELAFAKIAWLFYEKPSFPSVIHNTSIVHDSSRIPTSCYIGPFVHIGRETKIGQKTAIMTGSYIGNNVIIGKECLIYPNVVIMDNCVLGNRVIIHAGVVVGSDGFGYVTDSEGCHIKIPQVGNVIIEDDVEIGANSTIDRATFGSTIIKKGTKIDNMVHIGHNVHVGENCIMAGQVGIAGSVKLGNNVVMAGQVGIADHVEIGDRVRIGAKSGVHSSIPSGTDAVGLPAKPVNEFFKQYANIRRIDRLRKEIEELKMRIKELEDKSPEG